ncbi:MAG: hypothetical protein PHE84_03240 [bacterium]|nr:hypothetical protein [bacterium]
MRRLMTFILLILAGLGWGLFPAEVNALDTQAHGFGGWAYGWTNGNKYLIGDEDGSYTNSYFALNLSASPYEKLTANVQTIWQTSDEGVATDLDYGFAEWAFTEWLKLRIGKVKSPFGIYTETWDVGTLRPFYTLPPGFYGTPGAIATKAYYGLGLTGTRDLGSSWGLQYDLYGGKMDFPEMTTVDPTTMTNRQIIMNLKNAAGARITVQTPLDGLSAGVSSVAGDETASSVGNQNLLNMSGWHILLCGSLEYLRDPVLFRAEYGRMRMINGEDINYDTFYVEGAYKFLDHIQAAVRYDVKLIDYKIQMPISNIPDENKDLGFGLNYWFNPNLVIKASYHYVKGNVMAVPSDMAEYLTAMLTGKFKDSTHLFVFGTQFSF